MRALANPRQKRVTGAVMVDGEMLCFDAEDYDLEPGAEAVVIGTRGEIYVAPIADDHPEQKARLARIRCALIPFVSGRYPPGEPERLQVKVLGRYIPLPARAQNKAPRKALHHA